MRKINRRNFLKAAGILSAAVAGSLMTGCGGSDAGTQAAASNLTPYNELTVGTDHTDLTATIKVINHRTDLIQDGTFDGYVAEFQKLYPNITIEYEGITDYAGDMTTRLTSQEWGTGDPESGPYAVYNILYEAVKRGLTEAAPPPPTGRAARPA